MTQLSVLETTVNLFSSEETCDLCLHALHEQWAQTLLITHKRIQRVLAFLVIPSKPSREVNGVHHLAWSGHGSSTVLLIQVFRLLWRAGSKLDDSFIT